MVSVPQTPAHGVVARLPSQVIKALTETEMCTKPMKYSFNYELGLLSDKIMKISG